MKEKLLDSLSWQECPPKSNNDLQRPPEPPVVSMCNQLSFLLPAPAQLKNLHFAFLQILTRVLRASYLQTCTVINTHFSIYLRFTWANTQDRPVASLERWSNRCRTTKAGTCCSFKWMKEWLASSDVGFKQKSASSPVGQSSVGVASVLWSGLAGFFGRGRNPWAKEVTGPATW